MGGDGKGTAQKVFEGHRWVGMVMERHKWVVIVMGCFDGTFTTLT